MKVTTDATALERHVDASMQAAATSFQADVRGALTHRTGRTAAQTQIIQVPAEPGVLRYALVGPAQLGPLEHGADVGHRRGPHMAGQHRIASVADRFGDHLVAHLKGAG